MGVRVERAVTSGTFALDGGSWDVPQVTPACSPVRRAASTRTVPSGLDVAPDEALIS